ncbi:MAG: hypothetical protein O7G85_03480 [Planctomycetota bacterium]|nr:hypothetical protein [Planctomycetota bacterium]
MQRGFNTLNLTGLAMLMLPIIMIKMLALMLGVGMPKGVSASNSVVSTNQVTHGASYNRHASWSQAQHEATDYIDSLQDDSAASNPMLYGGRASQISITSPSLAKLYTLQMILSKATGNVALINNMQYHVGDRFGDTPWRIIAIDADARVVIARHDETGLDSILRVD